MVHVCCVPGCSTRSDRETHLSYFGLPLRDKKLLKLWIHRIGRTNLPVNGSTKVCSCHFQNATGRRLRPDESPSVNLPKPSTPGASRRPPRARSLLPQCKTTAAVPMKDASPTSKDVAVNTEVLGHSWDVKVIALVERVSNLEEQLEETKKDIDKQKFRLQNIADDDSKICFYTGFPSYKSLVTCFEFLGPAAHQLSYTSKSSETPGKICRPRSLVPLNFSLFWFVFDWD